MKDSDDNLLCATSRKCNWNTNRDQMTKKEHVENVNFVRMTSWFVMMYNNYSERKLCNQRNIATL
jgi:hypothetical protein